MENLQTYPKLQKTPYTNAEYIIYKKPLMKNQKIQYTSWEYEAQKKQGPCFNFYLSSCTYTKDTLIG